MSINLRQLLCYVNQPLDFATMMLPTVLWSTSSRLLLQFDMDLWTSYHFPQVAKDGLPLPPDRTLCPLCCQKRNNPSVLSVSGFVFCYSCIFKSVSQVDILLTSHSKQLLSVLHVYNVTLPIVSLQHKRCPVTLVPATVEQIRRLFHDL
jgi:hypothetical protein